MPSTKAACRKERFVGAPCSLLAACTMRRDTTTCSTFPGTPAPIPLCCGNNGAQRLALEWTTPERVGWA